MALLLRWRRARKSAEGRRFNESKTVMLEQAGCLLFRRMIGDAGSPQTYALP